jgi:hypothetical protein
LQKNQNKHDENECGHNLMRVTHKISLIAMTSSHYSQWISLAPKWCVQIIV